MEPGQTKTFMEDEEGKPVEVRRAQAIDIGGKIVQEPISPDGMTLDFRGNLIKEKVKELCNFWWKEVLKRSRRDQMSFNYALWKTPIPVKTLFPSISSSAYFSLWTHRGGTHKKAVFRKDYDTLQNYINGKPI
jgi:hypothetical protein